MKIHTSYKRKITGFNGIFNETLSIYRKAVDFYINVVVSEWDAISAIPHSKLQMNYIQSLTHKTKSHPSPKYDFDLEFYKFPVYLRRAAIMAAVGKVSSYKSNLANYESNASRGKAPSLPRAGHSFPCYYKGNMYTQTSDYEARIKIYRNNDWVWLNIKLRKSDADYIKHHALGRKECPPFLEKKGKEWFLNFPYEEDIKLPVTDIASERILAVDLGINCAATVSCMHSDGTVIGRKFLHLPVEKDHLSKAVNRIKKAQQHGARKTPRLWAIAKGINNDIAVKTAQFIADTAVFYNCDTIVFEHLDIKGKKNGSKKQRLHMWRSQYVQAMVTDKAHRLHMHVSHICAWGTSKLAYDGSGEVLRGSKAGYKTNTICSFTSGKQYNCDLSASKNIAARFILRCKQKSMSETAWLQAQAKVPELCTRTKCSLATLISLSAVVA